MSTLDLTSTHATGTVHRYTPTSGVYFAPEVTHVVLDAEETTDVSGTTWVYAFSLDGPRNTQFVPAESLSEPDADWIGKVLDGETTLNAPERPDWLTHDAYSRLIAWATDDMPSLPVGSDPVDRATSFLARIARADTLMDGMGDRKDFVGEMLRWKRRNLSLVFSQTAAEQRGVVEAFPNDEQEAALVAAGWLTPGDKGALERRVQDYRSRLTAEVEQHRSDIALIGERLLAEATSRNWCDEYDTIIRSLNSDLHVELPVREREVEFTVRGYLRVPFTYTMTVTVAHDEDAEEAAEREFNNATDAGDLIRYHADQSDAEIEDDPEFEED